MFSWVKRVDWLVFFIWIVGMGGGSVVFWVCVIRAIVR